MQKVDNFFKKRHLEHPMWLFFEKSEEIRFLLKIENNGVLRSLKVFDFLFFQDTENYDYSWRTKPDIFFDFSVYIYLFYST